MDRIDDLDENIDYLELARQAARRADALLTDIYEIIDGIEKSTQGTNPGTPSISSSIF